MGRRIFHILTESEPFSRFRGGAISRWVGSTVANDQDATVLCKESDASWEVDPSRIRTLPDLDAHLRLGRMLGRKLPWILKKPVLKRAITAGIQDLGAGDIVWVHNRPDFAAVISPYVGKRRARLVLHMHNSHLAATSSKVVREISADRIVFCSKFIEAEALGGYPDLGVTGAIPNGADEQLFYPAETRRSGNNGALELLFVGRLVPEKGVHVLIEAMSMLHSRSVPVKARIVGSASFGTNEVTPYVEGLHRNAPENVEFTGYVDPDKLGDEFRRADIFCCPSVWDEPFGMINVEAMATRIPVVATRCGGIPEIFAEGGALLVEPNSAPEIADACEQLVADPVLRDRIGKEGYVSFQKNYTWRSIHQHYREIVEALPA